MERKGELKDGESASPQDREQSSRDAQQNANAEQRQGEQEKAAQDGGEDAPAYSDAEKRGEQNRDGESASADGQTANEQQREFRRGNQDKMTCQTKAPNRATAANNPNRPAANKPIRKDRPARATNKKAKALPTRSPK